MDRLDYKVCGDRPLKFFPGVAKGSIVPGFVYGTEAGADTLSISTQKGSFKAYINGGPYFIDIDPFAKHLVEILATYPDGNAAILKCKVGKGLEIFLMVRFRHINRPSSGSGFSSD